MPYIRTLEDSSVTLQNLYLEWMNPPEPSDIEEVPSLWMYPPEPSDIEEDCATTGDDPTIRGKNRTERMNSRFISRNLTVGVG